MTATKTRPVQATAPERIYLQGGPQLPPETDFSALSEVTWCRDDVDGAGIPYVRADLAGAAPAAVAPVLDVTLDEDQAGLLRDMLGDPAEYEEALTVRLIVCDGHSGHGLYVAQAEYQDEGAVLLTALPAPAAPALEAPAASVLQIGQKLKLAMGYREHYRTWSRTPASEGESALVEVHPGHWRVVADALDELADLLAAAPEAPAAPVGVPAQGDPAALLQLAELLESGRSLIHVERKEAAHALRLQAAAAPAAPAVDASDTARMDWLETRVVNVRAPLRYGSRDMFWASPEEVDGGPDGPSDLRARIDAAQGGA